MWHESGFFSCLCTWSVSLSSVFTLLVLQSKAVRCLPGVPSQAVLPTVNLSINFQVQEAISGIVATLTGASPICLILLFAFVKGCPALSFTPGAYAYTHTHTHTCRLANRWNFDWAVNYSTVQPGAPVVAVVSVCMYVRCASLHSGWIGWYAANII